MTHSESDLRDSVALGVVSAASPYLYALTRLVVHFLALASSITLFHAGRDFLK